MAINLTVDLAHATFADLVALVEAAEVAGVDKHARVQLEETTLHVEVEPNGAASSNSRPRRLAETAPSQLPPLGDAAVRSVIDILTGRQEPPRR
ncbi:hypothetical protein [Corynebacterium mayonis]|uniref:hypothetical protein n=1 Tax=Corynebacterium mayonis TaxID=3062461 RepID=UPI0031409F3A